MSRLWAALLAVVWLPGCATLRHPGNRWWADDKAQHFVAFGLAGAAGALAAQHHDRSDGEVILIGVAVATGLGAGKEVIDDRFRNKYFSGKDLVWDILGGLAGSLIVVAAD